MGPKVPPKVGSPVEVGQLWADNDKRTRARQERQRLRVIGIVPRTGRDNDRAVLRDELTGKGRGMGR